MNKLVKNIVLIGMPGCGKTTIGRKISESLKMDFVDVDQYIEDTTGSKITEIFKKGEEHFRNIESAAICELSKANAMIISTGGGVIKKALNIQELKKKGIIIFINRPIENIVSDITLSSRPLLKDGVQKLYELFNERYILYKNYCDIEVINDGKIEAVIEKIIKIYTES